MIKSSVPAPIKIKPDKNFLRLDIPFNDAVRSEKASAIAGVLIQAELSGKDARRTAEKILDEQRRRRRKRPFDRPSKQGKRRPAPKNK